jgi:RNA polymerase sigma factor (sigma-70 family)
MQPDEQRQIFEQWLAEHAAVLHHVANGFAEGADRHDLMQDLLLALWRAVPVYRGGARPSTFIYRVAHNAALTWKRSERSYRRRVDGFEADALRETTTAPADHGREALDQLYAHIRRLPPVDRSLLLLHLDGVSYADMAEIHGLTETNVGVRLSRAKQKLTDTMQRITHELR